MRKLVILILLTLLASSVFAWRDNEMEVRVFYNNGLELAKLVDLNAKGDIYPNGEALIYLIPSEFEALKATGLKYKIEREDVKTYAENFWQSQDNTREAYHTYSEIVALADSLVAAFPGICEKHLFGTSVQGRELGALKISDNVTLDENEAEVMFDGGIHGDEIGASENCIRFARDLCRGYGNDPEITDLVDNREIWIYYMVNPDGRAADDRENANGVDCNRDSGYMWDGWSGSTGAYSQPESKALRDCHYNRQFVVHTTYHSGTEYISCPWSYRADQAPDYDHILQLAGEYSTSSGYTNMDYGQGCTGMYPINGSTKDTNYGIMGAISWSMEISYSKHPTVSQLMMYYNYNKPAMLSIIEHSGYGLEGIVTDVNTGDPVTAAVFVNDYFPTYTDVHAGDYHKYVLAGTYDVTVVANGYETQTITGISVVSSSSTATDFQLQPLEGQFVYKIASSRIPDNNTADEGDTPGVIGAPDNRNYSIGKDGWVVVDMQYPIIDGPGNDIKVYEGDASPEGYTVYAGESIDGPWYSLGTGSGTAEFDLSIGGLMETQFIKISDDGDGIANAADAGFDLDAVGALESVSGVYIGLMNYQIDDSSGNNNGRIDPGETVDIIITLQNNGDVLAESVNGTISTNSPYVTLDVANVDFGDLGPAQNFEGVYTLTSDEATPSGEDFELELDVSANSGSYINNYVMDFSVGGWLLEEYFDGTFPPADWNISGLGTGNWSGSATANAGGTAPEAKFGWSPSFTGESALTSPEINTTGLSSLNLTYNHFLNDYSGSGYSIGVKTTSDGGNTWNVVNEIFPTGAIGPETLELTVETTDVGSATFQIAFFFDGYSFDLNYYYIDNILLGGDSGGLVPPANLTAEIIDYNSSIIISWGGAVSSKQIDRDLLGYNIYFDGVFVANVTSSPYEFTGPFAPGDYYFEVTAVYDGGESEAAEITVTIVLNPPENLTAISSGTDIILTWEPPTPVRGIFEYKIYYEGLEISSTTETTCIIENVATGEHTYWVTVVYDGGYESDIAEVTIEHTNADELALPFVTKLTGNYPNPFNPTTTINFSLNEASHVTLNIYNMKGQLVKTLVNKDLAATYYDMIWDGTDDSNKPVSSGIYFYKMKAGKYQETKKMILMK